MLVYDPGPGRRARGHLGQDVAARPRHALQRLEEREATRDCEVIPEFEDTDKKSEFLVRATQRREVLTVRAMNIAFVSKRFLTTDDHCRWRAVASLKNTAKHAIRCWIQCKSSRRCVPRRLVPRTRREW